MNAKRLNIWAPILFWILLFAVNLIRVFPFVDAAGLERHLATLARTFPLDILTFSLFYFWIVPKLMAKKQVPVMVTLGLAWWLLFSLVWVLVYHFTGRADTQAAMISIYKSSIGHSVLHTLYAVVLRFAVDWYNKYQRQKELEKANLKAELALLQAQLNPHFLFNVMNNIHSFVHTDPDKTSFSLIKLSEIMRYMLYETGGQRVTLDKEIAYIQNYLSLQKLRLQDPGNVIFEVKGDPHGVEVAPLVFISFIENAFKHGKKNLEGGIRIAIDIGENDLDFRCSNYIRPLTESEMQYGENIGLKNVRRRLELLYPGKHELSVTKDEERFVVRLKIDLEP